MSYSLNIGHLYCDLLNMYGEKGNIAALKNRMSWRGYNAEVMSFEENDEIDFKKLDIIILGGGGEKDELKALKKLREVKDELAAFVEDGGVLLAFCGGFQMLGKFFPAEGGQTDGLGILDMTTEAGERFIGNVIARTNITGQNLTIAGFENHGGRTFIGNLKPFAEILTGNGNNGEDKTCGAIYKNTIGTYLHGPLLPKNPQLTDHILKTALKRKYGEDVCLAELSDKLEEEALQYAVKRFSETGAR